MRRPGRDRFSVRTCGKELAPATRNKSSRTPIRLRMDLDFCAVGNHFPDFVYLAIGDGDAALGPVQAWMTDVTGAPLCWQAVDHDLPAGVNAALAGQRPVALVGVGDMKGAMKFRPVRIKAVIDSI